MTNLFHDLFIFEMANNHQGIVEHGLNIIKRMSAIARKHNIRAGVKFQYRDLDTLIHPDYVQRKDVPHIPRFMDTRLTRNDFLTLVHAVQDEGLVTICTPFDEASVGQILDHGIQIVKVASCSATDWPLLEVIAETKKPVICSTGGLSMYDIDNVVSFLAHRQVDFALLHCIGIYPAPNSELQLNSIDRLKNRFPSVPIGYSGHEDPTNTDVVKVAVAKGATILERHVGLPSDSIKLNQYSMSPEQADIWVSSALSARAMCDINGGEKRITQAERDSLRSLARGVYASRDIAAGETIERKDVFFAMPCQSDQMTSSEYQDTIIASRNYRRGNPVMERRKSSVIRLVRGIVHDVKGMLYEAHVHPGNDIEIELSHHYGIEQFRQFGVVILNIINREYCKKIVVVLPSQQHPNHRHKVKEETFQLLWGDLDVQLDERTVHLLPGDKVLVERGMWHAFSSKQGAIFEEVSTTHIKGDSEYDDPRIASKDPLERKTLLDDW